MNIVIFSGGKIQDGYFVKEAINSADLVIAADSGAEDALKFNLVPKKVLGDFDSINKKTKEILEKKGVEFVPFPGSKDETDTELAVEYAKNLGATTINIIGGVLGNRIDHVLGNIFMFIDKVEVYFINKNQKSWVLKGPSFDLIKGEKGDLLSLIPIIDVFGVKTSGLKYSLKNETLFFGKTRGISNEFEEKEVKVEFKSGIMIAIQTH